MTRARSEAMKLHHKTLYTYSILFLFLSAGFTLVSSALSFRLANPLLASAYSPQTLDNHSTNLTSPNAQSNGAFGYSVATSATLAAVGAPSESASGFSSAGHAYLFNATSGALINALTTPNPQIGGNFGYSIAIVGKVALVGAPNENSNGKETAGRAYVFNAATGKLIKTLTSPHSQNFGNFGWSISVSGKIAVIGAPYESSNGVLESGRAYVFDIESGAQIRTLSSPNPQYDGQFGDSVALTANFVIVGAPTENASGQQYAGHSYVFSATTGALIKTLTSANPQYDGVFGRSVAISGDTIVVGAYGESAKGQPDAGHAYIFLAATGKLIKTLTSPHPQTYQEFGFSVAASSKIVVVGAPSAGGGSGPADAYLFNAATGALINTLGNSHGGGEFGYAVAAKGNLEIVSASHENVHGKQAAGEAYIF
jgi:hypothetical protein